MCEYNERIMDLGFFRRGVALAYTCICVCIMKKDNGSWFFGGGRCPWMHTFMCVYNERESEERGNGSWLLFGVCGRSFTRTRMMGQ